MKRIRPLWKSALLVAGAALMTLALWLLGVLLLLAYSNSRHGGGYISAAEISAALVQTEQGYEFSEGQRLNERGAWAMLIGDSGQVLWSFSKPAHTPEHYSIRDVAAFSKWYLDDYPVQCRIRDDGLFVLAMPKFSAWKYNVLIEYGQLRDIELWAALMLLLSLLLVIWLSSRLVKRRLRREQERVDAARADWINGVSHDIRTPLSLVMGYSARLSAAETLPAEARGQADIILKQSQLIKELVGDLNLTMRLSYNMEPLRRELIDPVALTRQAAADLLNSGLDSRYELLPELPVCKGETVFADAALLKRAIKNLLDNCVRHNPEGCRILLGLRREKETWVFTVESHGDRPVIVLPRQPDREPGESEHGTGLKLVRRIAAVHGGSARFTVQGPDFRCELRIPG